MGTRQASVPLSVLFVSDLNARKDLSAGQEDSGIDDLAKVSPKKETAWSTQTVRKYLSLLELPSEIQQKIGTAGGSGGVGAHARLATTFHGREAIEVYEKISGFKQTIQEEILKRSVGDTAQIDGLVGEAMEGAFDVRRRGGCFKCEIICDILEGEIGLRDFQKCSQTSG